MPMIFTNAEIGYLKTLLNGGKPAQFWAKDTILGKIDDEEERAFNAQKCEHTYGKYKGLKECCTLCGHFDKDMGTEWELIK